MTKFLEESPGVRSYQRLQSLMMMVFFFIITGYQVYKASVDFELILLLMVGALAPKLIQKFAEGKVPMTAAPPVYGCMNKGALNYNPDATMDDGSCIFAAPEKPEG